MSQPFISVRKSIRWLPDPPSEPTTTVVLTSAAGLFVDIRLLLTAATSREDYVGGNDDDDVEWAFAGRASSSPAEDGRPAHTVWTHWIDSKSDAPVSDEGEMYPQPDGDVLERGSMQNPNTGKNTEYEEIWHDLDVPMLEGEERRVCTVLRADSPSTGAKGMIIRIGDWYQGMLKTSHGLTIERWQWSVAAEPHGDKAAGQGNGLTPHSKWNRLARLGSGSLPSPSALAPGKVAKGATTEVNGIIWKAVETYQW